MDSKTKYVEIASGTITRRGNAVKKSQLHNYIDKKEAQHELYHSWYTFDHEMAQYVKVNNSPEVMEIKSLTTDNPFAYQFGIIGNNLFISNENSSSIQIGILINLLF